MATAMIICNCPKCESKRIESMSKRYIVIEEKDAIRQQTFYTVYEKGWLFNTYVKVCIDRKSAIDLILRLIRDGSKNEKKIVFDSKKDLSFDIHF